MAIFNRLYEKIISYSSHQHAPYYLASLSFIEASVFPIPPDVMLIPMVLSRPTKAWQFATITMVASILGGLIGYLIGYYAFEWIGEPLIQAFHYQSAYSQVTNWFANYGFWAVLLAGFTPIPYKLFTIGAGAAQMAILPFVIASFLGRGLRFFLVAALVRQIGKKIEPIIVKYLDRIGWIAVALTLVGFFIYQFLK